MSRHYNQAHATFSIPKYANRNMNSKFPDPESNPTTITITQFSTAIETTQIKTLEASNFKETVKKSPPTPFHRE